jgi:four helix bundle suffix protein
MNLTNVARGSLDELRKDYIAYLTRWSHGLNRWAPDDPRFIEARNLRPQTMDDAIAWVNRPADEPARERAANLGAILSAQAEWLAGRMLDSQAETFEQDGGFSERLHHARTHRRV